MPFSNTVSEQPFIERARRLRTKPVWAYAAALVAVAIATLARAALGDELIEGVPFITFYPAVVVATFLGGLRPGIAAIALSALIAWYVFLPPPMSWQIAFPGVISLVLFSCLATLNAGIVALLNAAIDRIVTQEKNQRILIEFAPNGIVVADRRGGIRIVNKSAETMFGYQRAELVGETVEKLVPEAVAEAHRRHREAFLQNPMVRAMGEGRDLKGRRKDGSEFPLEIGLSPLVNEGDHSVLATVIDISERRKAQVHGEMLMTELHHRTRNLFMIAQVMVTRSLAEGRTLAEGRDLLLGRLRALARAYQELAAGVWQGALLSEVVQRELGTFSTQLTQSGCAIMLTPTGTEQFTLVLHELATNAIKHGALSAPDGRVSVEGRIDNDNLASPVFRFTWREIDGPPVKEPARKGFGSTILLDAVKPTATRATLNYERDGVVYQLEVPLAAIAVVSGLPSNEGVA